MGNRLIAITEEFILAGLVPASRLHNRANEADFSGMAGVAKEEVQVRSKAAAAVHLRASMG